MGDEVAKRYGYSMILPPKVFEILRNAVAAKIRENEEYELPFISLEGFKGEPGRLIVLAGVVLPGLGLVNELAKQLGEDKIELTKKI